MSIVVAVKGIPGIVLAAEGRGMLSLDQTPIVVTDSAREVYPRPTGPDGGAGAEQRR